MLGVSFGIASCVFVCMQWCWISMHSLFYYENYNTVILVAGHVHAVARADLFAATIASSQHLNA